MITDKEDTGGLFHSGAKIPGNWTESSVRNRPDGLGSSGSTPSASTRLLPSAHWRRRPSDGLSRCWERLMLALGTLLSFHFVTDGKAPAQQREESTSSTRQRSDTQTHRNGASDAGTCGRDQPGTSCRAAVSQPRRLWSSDRTLLPTECRCPHSRPETLPPARSCWWGGLGQWWWHQRLEEEAWLPAVTQSPPRQATVRRRWPPALPRPGDGRPLDPGFPVPGTVRNYDCLLSRLVCRIWLQRPELARGHLPERKPYDPTKTFTRIFTRLWIIASNWM